MVTALPLRVTLAVAGGLGMDLPAGLSIFMSPIWAKACGGEEGTTGGGCQGAEEHERVSLSG